MMVGKDEAKWMVAMFFCCFFSIQSLSGLRLLVSDNCNTDDMILQIPTAHKTQTTHQTILSPIHVSFGLSGNHTGFLSEFEVALKSVLLHAPLERSLHIHILADQYAYSILHSIFNRIELISTWTTRNPIEIHIYDVSPAEEWLEEKIVTTMSKGLKDDKFTVDYATGVHTIGCFYRLIAHKFLPSNVKQLLYMDTDVVIMTNLEELWKEVESSTDSLFHWGIGMCSGFIVLNVQHMEEIWSLAQSTNMRHVVKTYNQKQPADQLIFKSVNVTYPNEVNILSDGWDMSVTLRWQKRHLPYAEKYPNVGMLHFNGGLSSKEAYFTKTGQDDWMVKFHDTWGIANYTVKLPWSWARYQSKSLIRSGMDGHLIQIHWNSSDVKDFTNTD